MVKGETQKEAILRRQIRRAKKQTPETVQLNADGSSSTTSKGGAAARSNKAVRGNNVSAAGAKPAEQQQQQQQQNQLRRLKKQPSQSPPNNNDINHQQAGGAAAAAAEEQQRPDMIGKLSFRRTMTDKRQTNMQKMLVIGSRSMNHKARHLLQDMCSMMAHGRPHPKLDARNDVGTHLQELCALHNCNGSVFLESRKADTNYLWFAQAPDGPSMKMQLFNVHTADELRMVGNCLKYSRPLLHFDAEFETVPHLRIARALLTSAFNVPRYHSRSKPFVDHIACFFVLEGKIYFRHYQILEGAAASAAASAASTSIATSGAGMGGGVSSSSGRFGLTEIGPRFVLDPQVLLQGCVRGQVVWKSESAVSPTEQRRSRKQRALAKTQFNEHIQDKGEKHREKLPAPGPDPLSGTFKRE